MSLMSREFEDETRYRGSQNAVATTFLVSFEQIRSPDPVAVELLSFISCIETKAIPRSFLPSSQSEEEMDFAIGTLSAYAFLVRRGDDEVYDMHRLVHLATRVWIRRQKRTEDVVARTAHHLLAGIMEIQSKHANYHEPQAYLPHAIRVLDSSFLPPCLQRYFLAYAVGEYLLHVARFNESIQYLEDAFTLSTGQGTTQI